MRFRRAGKIYSFEATLEGLALGDMVVVETERGVAIGKVASEPRELGGTPQIPLKKILRAATPEDVEKDKDLRKSEVEAQKTCQALIAQKALPMKLLGVESVFDRSKMIFNFASEGRVDFRELVRDLARLFHTRIEMRQVGVRDEAKILGGVGCCGKELCCAQWLTDFAPISVRMAKSQNIALNPAKISGICGRLLCCLAYEHQMYEDLGRGMPKVGKKVATQKGEGKVIRRNPLEGTFVIYGDHGEAEISLEEFKKWKAAQGQQPVEESHDDHDDHDEAEGAEGIAAIAEEAARQRPQRQPERKPEQRQPEPRQPEAQPRQPQPQPPQQQNRQGAAPQEGQQVAQPAGQARSKRRRRRRRPPQAGEKKDG